MKAITLFISLLALTFFVACGGGDTTTPEPDDTLIISGTIGENGGELSTEDVVMLIPAGAFDQENEVAIHLDAEICPFGTGVSQSYRVTGLPQQLSEPITLRMRHNGAKADTAMMFLGEEREAYEGGRGRYWFHVATRDSAGWCIATIDRGPYVLDDEKAEPNFAIATSYGMTWIHTSGGHFHVFYNPNDITAGRIALFSASLEQAWNKVYDFGFHFGDTDIWPRPVYIGDMNGSLNLAEYITAPFGKGYYNFSSTILANSIVTGMVTGHEVFHSGQDFFDSRPPSEWKSLNYQRLPLDEATASWFEGKFYDGDDFSPFSMCNAYYSIGLNSFAGARGYSHAEVGYSWATLIKYIADTQGEDRIMAAYNAFPEAVDGAAALLSVLDPPMIEWAADYHQKLVLNQIYDFVEPGDLWYASAVENTLIGGSEHSFTDSWKMWPLGASATVFAMEDERDDQASALEVHSMTSEPIQLAVYGLNANQQPVLLGTGRDSVRVDDLPDLIDDYEKFMAMGTHLVDWDSADVEYVNIHPVVKLVDDNLARFEMARVRMGYAGLYGSGYSSPRLLMDIDADIGRVSNHVYRAVWDSIPNGSEVHVSGHFIMTFDPETMALVSWSAESNRYDPATLTQTSVAINGTGLPVDYSTGTKFHYVARDEATCGVVTNVTSFRIIDGEWDNWLESYWCTEDSYLMVDLEDRE